MARIKAPENETSEQKSQRLRLEKLANQSTRSEKTSWNRKLDNMMKLLLAIEPIEEEILELIKTKKQPIVDEISILRATMVKECIHPYEYLTEKDGIITCKFCMKRIHTTS